MIELIKKTITTKEVFKFIPGKPFNPDFDGNALVWYDGDSGLNNLQWNDRGGGGHDIIFVNNPTILTPGINGHSSVVFNGITQHGQVATPAMNQPYSIYIVSRLITWVIARYNIDDGVTVFANKSLTNSGISPQRSFRAGVNVPVTNNEPALNNYDILTLVVNGANSEYRWNNNLTTVVNFGVNNGAGITLADRQTIGAKSNIEFAYIIIRTGADSTAKQNVIINGLKSRFAL